MANPNKAIQMMPDDILHQTLSNTIPESSCKVAVDEVVVNVFFDGTMNNLFNVKANTPNRGTSYSNAHSNISWMYQAVPDDKHLKVYVEGIGTLADAKDTNYGAGLGYGQTGVVARAQEGFKKVVDALERKKLTDCPINQLTLNVFGFSRGAATARYFVHELKTNPKAFRKHSGNDSLRIQNCSVNFMGLFDTVSSLGAFSTNDAKPYNQQIRKGWAARVFHLVAGDEFRTYFPVTTINTAIANGFGYELEIPGSHSDVGGGYPDDTEALRWTSHQAKGYSEHLPWWGWYRENQMYAEYRKTNYGMGYWDCWTKTRSISNEYYKVGLNIMTEMTKRHVDADDLSFDGDLPTSTSDHIITRLKKTLTDYAIAGDKQGLKHSHFWRIPRTDPSWDAPAIYNKFFHFSADFNKTGMSPNIDGDGKPYRYHIRDSDGKKYSKKQN